MKSTFLYCLLVLFYAFSSCTKDKDSPQIDVVEPDELVEVAGGEELHIEAVFSDDRGLKSYKIYLTDLAGEQMALFPLSYEDDIEGKSYQFHEHEHVPDGFSAEACLWFEVTDQEGKVSQEKKTIKILN